MSNDFNIVSALTFTGFLFTPHLGGEASYQKANELWESLSPSDKHYVCHCFLVGNHFGRTIDLKTINSALVEGEIMNSSSRLVEIINLNSDNLWQFISSCHETKRHWNVMSLTSRHKVIQSYFDRRSYT